MRSARRAAASSCGASEYEWCKFAWLAAGVAASSLRWLRLGRPYACVLSALLSASSSDFFLRVPLVILADYSQ